MKISKRHILGVAVVAGLAVVGLVACGKNDKKGEEYTVVLDAGADGATLGSTSVEFTDYTDLITKLNTLEATREHYIISTWNLVLDDGTETSVYNIVVDGFDFKKVVRIDAVWESAPYTVKLDYKGNAESYSVKSSSGSISTKYLATIEETKAKPTGSGLTADGNPMSFVGWYTDSALTTAYDFTTKVEGNFTLYAKWEIKTITTAQDFADYVNSDSTINAEITKDAELDFTNIAFTRDNTLDKTKTSNKENGDYSVTLSHVLSGNGATLKNIKITNSLKFGGLFAKVTGGITDLTFKDCTFISPIDTSGFLAGEADGAVIEDIVFDNVTANVGKYGAMVVSKINGDNTVSISGIVVKDSKITATDNFTGVIVSSIQGNSSTVKITDCVVDAQLIGKSEGAGLVVAEIKGTQAELTIDGVVVKGSVTCGKNAAGVLGNVNKASIGKKTISNVLVSDLTVTLSGTQGGLVVGYVATSNGATAPTGKNIYSRKYSNTTTGTTDQFENSTLIADLTAKDGVVSLTKNITVNVSDLKVSLNKTEVATLTADPEVVEVKEGTVSVTGASYTSATKTISGEIAYEQAAAHTETGFTAGNYVKVQITADDAITDTTGYRIAGAGKYASLSDKVITAYLSVTADELKEAKKAGTDITKTISVDWYVNASKAAKTVDYKFTISKDATCAVYTPTYAESVTVTGATYVGYTNNTEAGAVITVSGEVAYDTQKEGNYVTLEITMPVGVSLTDASKVKVNGTAVEASAISSQTITAVVKVVGTSSTFTLQCGDTDPVEYTIKGFTCVAGPSQTYTLNVSSIYSSVNTAADSQNNYTITAGTYGDFKLVKVKTDFKTGKSSTPNIELAKSMENYIEFTVAKAATITYSISSTANNNVSNFEIYKGDTKLTTQAITGSTSTEFTYEITEAGTYKIGCDSARGGRIFALTVTEK